MSCQAARFYMARSYISKKILAYRLLRVLRAPCYNNFLKPLGLFNLEDKIFYVIKVKVYVCNFTFKVLVLSTTVAEKYVRHIKIRCSNIISCDAG